MLQANTFFNAALMLRLSGLPAYTPDTKGSMTRSKVSAPIDHSMSVRGE